MTSPGHLWLPGLSALGPRLGPILTAAAVAGYFLGALPFGYLVARAKGVDIFSHGSGSPGATNVRRVLGARSGNLVFALDALKGGAAAAWPVLLVRPGFEEAAGLIKLLGILSLIFALLGHSFSCFTRFRGGKGVATGAGGFLLLMPPATLLALGVWIACFYGTRYVSVASISAALALPLAAWLWFSQMPFLVASAAAICLFVIVRHRGNIRRLIDGTENRFSRQEGGGR